MFCDLRKIERREENVIISSDINRKVGNDSLGIKGNAPDVSYGGRLVRELIAPGNYFFVNNSDVVKGGPNTRIDPSNCTKKSVLDVFILSKGLRKYVEKMVIDDEYKYLMQYPVKENGNITMRKSDHLTLILYLKNLLTNLNKKGDTKIESGWNFNKKEAGKSSGD